MTNLVLMYQQETHSAYASI